MGRICKIWKKIQRQYKFMSSKRKYSAFCSFKGHVKIVKFSDTDTLIGSDLQNFNISNASQFFKDREF